MRYGLHSHNFRGVTTLDDAHVHRYADVTSLNPNVPGHIHYISGVTTFNNGHTHRYTVTTGPGLPVAGGHIHYYRVATSFDLGHIHYINGYTAVY